MSDQMLAEVHALLTAIGTRDSLITFIDGWTLFQNSEAGPYVGLYNTRKGKRDGRVYVYGFTEGGNDRPLNHEFKKLPTWLKDQVLALLAKEQPPEAPRSETTEYIQQKNLLRKCQTFKVIRYKFDSAGDDEKKEPWRIVKCFDIGNGSGNGDNQRQPTQEQAERQPAPTATKPTPPQQRPTQAPATPQPATAAPATSGASKPAPANGKPVDTGDDAKKAQIRAMFKAAQAIYGEAGAAAAMLTIGKEISRNNNLAGLSQLTTDQLRHIDAILQLQQAGINEYGDAAEWSEALPVLLQEYGKESVYESTPHQIAKMIKDITNAPGDKGGIPF